MFVPGHFQPENEAWAVRLIEGHPLAVLVSNGDPAPLATHLPALRAPETAPGAPLAGSELICHLNRANPHWAALADGLAARIVFHGPHGYVTPAVYPAGPAAPTWNFTAVHVLGRIRLLRSPEESFAVVRETAERLEGSFGAGWEAAGSFDYFRRILRGVGAFRLRIESVEAMCKLSQDQSVENRERVAGYFEADPGGERQPLARLMRELGGACPHRSLIQTPDTQRSPRRETGGGHVP
jgi:transcriptional regulator